MTEAENSCATLLVHEVLETGKVQSFFQPIVSIQRKSIIGFEAFARGLSGGEDQVIKPKDLFASCHDADTQLAVDRACRDASLEQFQSIYKSHKNVLLFLNINLGAMTAKNVDKDYLLKKATEFGYDPRHIVIEMESSKISPKFPKELFQYYRNKGFRYCIDDMGSGDLGLDKLFMIKPDFIKVSRDLYSDISNAPYKTDMLKSLCRVAEELGCSVIGKSVEVEEEAFDLLERGITHQQGFFFTKTKGDDSKKDPLEVFREKIHNVHDRYRKRVSESIKSKKEMFDTYHKLSSKIMYRLEAAPSNEFPELCKRICMSIPQLAGIFVLDEAGIQKTARWTKIETPEGKPSLKEMEQRADHSIKDYVLYLNMGFEKFVTPPFTSALTKTEHTIISRRFFNREGKPCILCAEFPYTAS